MTDKTTCCWLMQTGFHFADIIKFYPNCFIQNLFRIAIFFVSITDSTHFRFHISISLNQTVLFKACFVSVRLKSTHIHLLIKICKIKLSRETTFPTRPYCTQRRFRSACASSQSNQRIRCPPEDGLYDWLQTECRTQTLIRLLAKLSLRVAHLQLC